MSSTDDGSRSDRAGSSIERLTGDSGRLRLMGTIEVGSYLGVKRQRVDQLRRAKTLGFPEPVAQLRMGPVWLADDIEVWAGTWKRKTGHPRGFGRKEKE